MMRRFLSLLVLLVIHTVTYAQIINPCGGTDDDDVCPLDTWVYVMVFAFVAFGAYKLHQKQKPLTA